jgi:hypothetical protein
MGGVVSASRVELREIAASSAVGGLLAMTGDG